uniref:DUF19 domain-containing protein n=1 Tax=Panagrellus redivivus TaxID=6233 RepID=A0A7E4WAE4_PANRE
MTSIFVILFAVVATASAQGGGGGLMGLLNPRDIAEIAQMAMQLGAQTVNSNRELMEKPGRPEAQPISSNASPSELIGQSFTNLLNPKNMNFMNLGNMANTDNAPPLERTQQVAKPVASLPKEFGAPTLFSAAPKSGIENIAGPAPSSSPSVAPMPRNLGGMTLTPEMERGGQQLLELASNFLGGNRGGGSRDRAYASRTTSGSGRGFGGFNGGGRSAGGSNNENLIPNIRQLVPGAGDNFGMKKGDGCLPFVSEFMQIAYGNCVKRADQRTWDAWGREIENGISRGRFDFLRASKETCRMVAEREQCGQLRRAVSECDIINSIQIGMNMQRSIQRCDEVGGIIDQNPATIMEGMSGMINGEVAQGFLNNFLG